MINKYYKKILEDIPYPISIWHYNKEEETEKEGKEEEEKEEESELSLVFVRCQWVNKMYEISIGQKKEEIIGKNILDMIELMNKLCYSTTDNKSDISEKLIAAIKDIFTTSTATNKSKKEYTIEIDNDKLKMYNIKIKYLYEQYFYILVEIKDKENIQNDYNFLSNISHEIRTPLNGIIGITSLLADTQLTTEQTDYVEILKQSGYNLMAIINDILDATKLELHKIALNETSFYLRDCIESSFDIISSLASKKKLDCSFDIKENVPNYIIGDYQRLRQILVNLLSNAVKFTKKGSITLLVQLIKKEEEKKEEEEKNEEKKEDKKEKQKKWEIEFNVVDTGIGIAKNDMKKLFKAFTQIDQSTTKEFEGTGLGLVISKQLCELMGGTIGCESKLNEGSNFHFTIKAKGFLEIGKTEHKKRNFDITLMKNKKIMVVDDKEENRTYLQITLYKLGLCPYLFASGEEALTYMRYNNVEFDLGLIDICMPRMDGNKFAQELKNKHISIPLIALSSLGDKEINSNLFVTYLLKPIHEEKLITAIYNHSSNTTDSSRKGLSNSSDCCFSNVDEKKSIPILIAEDIYLNQKVIIGILNKLGYKNIDIVENGKQVLQKLKHKKYCVIFMDIKMPLMDGITASKKIHKLYGEDRPKIIALTAIAMKGDKEKYIKDGNIDGYLIKPIDLNILHKELERILNG